MGERVVAALMDLIQAKHPPAYKHSQEIVPIQLVRTGSYRGQVHRKRIKLINTL